jgi:hypothetical protein
MLLLALVSTENSEEKSANCLLWLPVSPKVLAFGMVNSMSSKGYPDRGNAPGE